MNTSMELVSFPLVPRLIFNWTHNKALPYNYTVTSHMFGTICMYYFHSYTIIYRGSSRAQHFFYQQVNICNEFKGTVDET